MFFDYETQFEELEAKLEETQRLLKIAIERIAALEERLNKNSKVNLSPQERSTIMECCNNPVSDRQLDLR
jgi:hypothetical protein